MAGRQHGCVTWAQLRGLGLPDSTVTSWSRSGFLAPVLPRVYAVGRQLDGATAWLFALVLFAGPGAAISHGTAAHHRGWLRYAVRGTHVSTPRRIRASVPGVVIHSRSRLDRETVDGVPCTTVIRTLLDLAASEPLALVQRSLAQLDYARELDHEAIRCACGRGRPGSASLRAALSTYIPAAARTRSELEDEFLALCKRFGVPLPEVNTVAHGIEADAYWPEAALAVELDGGANHSSAAQRNRDQRRALKFRAHGVQVVRYTHDQVTRDGAAVAADLLRELAARRTAALAARQIS